MLLFLFLHLLVNDYFVDPSSLFDQFCNPVAHEVSQAMQLVIFVNPIMFESSGVTCSTTQTHCDYWITVRKIGRIGAPILVNDGVASSGTPSDQINVNCEKNCEIL